MSGIGNVSNVVNVQPIKASTKKENIQSEQTKNQAQNNDLVSVSKMSGGVPSVKISFAENTYSDNLIKLYEKSKLDPDIKATLSTLISQQGMIVSQINNNTDAINNILGQRKERVDNKEAKIDAATESLGMWVDPQSADYAKMVQLQKAKEQISSKREAIEERVIANVQNNTSQVTSIYSQSSKTISEFVMNYSKYKQQGLAEEKFMYLYNQVQQNTATLNAILFQQKNDHNMIIVK